MIEKLIEYVVDLPDVELPLMTLQDMALCQVWFASYRDAPKERRDYGDVPTVVGRWARVARRPADETEGRRHQWVLRDLIDELQAERAEGLQRDELEFLLAVHALTQQAKDPSLFERVGGLLGAFADTMQSACESMALVPGLPALSARLHVVTTIDIQRAPRREIKRFAGIDLPVTGPVLTYKGHLKVLGDVPESCTLVVEDGSCSIEGFVMGKVAATANCEVRENISGMVVVRKGSVRARDIVNLAHVVSKGENVVCRRAQMPGLIFAGREIRVMTGAIMGKYIAPHIRVDGEVYGGEFHVSSRLRAERFRRSDTRPLSIVLRSGLSCADYGEQPDKQARRLLSEAARLRRRLAGLADMAGYAEREAEALAKNAIYYLCAHGDSHELIRDVYVAQRRLAVLDRIVTGFQSLTLTAEDHLAGTETPPAEQAEGSGRAVSSLALIEEEITQLETEGSLDTELQESAEELNKANVRLNRPQLSRDQLVTILRSIREHLAAVKALRLAAEEVLREREAQTEKVVELSEALRASFEKSSNVHALRSIVKAVGSRSKADPLVRRLQTNFMRLALRNVNRRLQLAKQYRVDANPLARQFAEVREQLRRDYQITVAEYQSAWERPAQATGRFDEGVRVYVDVHSISQPDTPPGGVLVTESSPDVKTYCRDVSSVVEACVNHA